MSIRLTSVTFLQKRFTSLLAYVIRALF